MLRPHTYSKYSNTHTVLIIQIHNIYNISQGRGREVRLSVLRIISKRFGNSCFFPQLVAADGCCCSWRQCCLTSGNRCAAGELQHPSGHREPRGTAIQCDPTQAQVINTAGTAAVGKPVHPVPNLMMILPLKIHWEKAVSESHLLENTVSFLFPQGKLHIDQWQIRNISHF